MRVGAGRLAELSGWLVLPQLALGAKLLLHHVAATLSVRHWKRLGRLMNGSKQRGVPGSSQAAQQLIHGVREL